MVRVTTEQFSILLHRGEDSTYWSTEPDYIYQLVSFCCDNLLPDPPQLVSQDSHVTVVI